MGPVAAARVSASFSFALAWYRSALIVPSGFFSCAADCAPSCGNERCEGNETSFSCPYDCGYCGDAICGAGESASNSSSQGSSLPFTGGNVALLTAIGAVVVISGVGLVFYSRRRRATT